MNNNLSVKNALNYWNEQIKKNKDNKETVILALMEATDDITTTLNPSMSSATLDKCKQDFGVLNFNDSYEYFPCIGYGQAYGCCMFLHCEVRNCKIDAALEFYSDISISSEQIGGAIIATTLDRLSWLLRVPRIVSIQGFLTLQSILGVIDVIDLVLDWVACEWDAVFNYEEWTTLCGCDCPLAPECNVINPESPIGGFVFPEDCDF